MDRWVGGWVEAFGIGASWGRSKGVCGGWWCSIRRRNGGRNGRKVKTKDRERRRKEAEACRERERCANRCACVAHREIEGCGWRVPCILTSLPSSLPASLTPSLSFFLLLLSSISPPLFFSSDCISGKNTHTHPLTPKRVLPSPPHFSVPGDGGEKPRAKEARG